MICESLNSVQIPGDSVEVFEVFRSVLADKQKLRNLKKVRKTMKEEAS